MEAFRITLLSLILWMAYVPYAVQGEKQYAQVGATIELKCPSGVTETTKYRSWSKGKWDDAVKPPVDMLIYKGQGTDISEGKLLRPDIKIDPSTFTMTLIVQEDGRDNGYFTCVTEKAENLYDTQEVLIFLQPNITIATDVQPAEGVNVTVICTVERLYPNITSDQFTMTWNNQNVNDAEFSGAPVGDGSMSYTLEKSKNLTSADEGKTVACTVRPGTNLGKDVTEPLVLNFTMVHTTPPSSGGSNVGTTIGRVISGLAAVVIFIAISESKMI